MRFLRQSTAVDVAIGPFLDSTDGITAETGLTLSQADIRLKKNNGAWAQVSDATAATHEENGWYEKELDATDTNTLGILIIAVHESGALPVWHTFHVVPANIWDSWFSTDLQQVDVTQWLGAAVATPTVSGVPEVDLTHWLGTAAAAPSVAGVPEVDVTHIASSAVSTSSAQLGVNVVNAAGTAWNSGAIGPNTLASATITSAKFATDAITATVIAADAIGSSELAASAVTEIQSGLATSAALATVDDFLDTEIAAILAAVDTEVAAIKAVTDQFVFTVSNQVDANVLGINGSGTATVNLGKTTNAIGRGTCNTGGSTTSVPTSAFDPDGAVADQFKGRTILFDADTTTAALRGQQAEITASSNAANPTFTVSTLTTAPASGDTFSVV